MAALIAWRIRTGTYPDITRLKGTARYKQWGYLRDAAIFVSCVVALMVLFIQPEIAKLRNDPSYARDWKPLMVAAMVAFTNALRSEKRREDALSAGPRQCYS